MASRFWPNSGDWTTDSSASSESGDSARDTSEADEEIQEEISATRNQNNGTVTRQLPMAMRLPELSPQQRASIFYLSLIEGRCRTQAANTLNAGRRPEERFPDDHPEVCDLAEHLFSEMTRDLVRAGMFPEELTHHSVPQLRQYLHSFDALLNNLATNRSNFVSQQQNYPAYSVTTSSTSFSLPRESTTLFNPETALIRPNPTISHLNVGSHHEPSSETEILSLFSPGGNKASSQSGSFKKSFIEIEELGKGGFGTVFKARYRLDRGIYAIKKVAISSQEFRKLARAGKLRSLISEVSSLARLDHPHIVRYMHCWVEPCGPGTIETEEVVDQIRNKYNSTSFDPIIKNLESEIESQNGRLEIEVAKTKRAKSIILLDDENPFSTAAESDRSETGHGTNNNVSKMQIGRLSKTPFNFDAHLYIKMKLYPSTLNEYIGKPTEESRAGQLLSAFTPETKSPEVKPKHCFHPCQTLKLLTALVKGIQYLHRKNIIHRDLKPENIFLSILSADEEPTTGYFAVEDCHDCYPDVTSQRKSTYICPCIGDFGLIHILGTNTDDSDDGKPWPSTSAEYGESNIVGTAPYVPNEVPVICPKQDVFALGVIALELSTKFEYGSDRARSIEDVKRGIYTPRFKENPFSEGIKAMVRQNRDLRWTMEEVRQWLDSLHF